MKEGIRTLFKFSGFGLLWGGDMVSRFGDAISSIALIWLALELSGSPLIMSTVMICSLLPSLFFTIPAGAFVDKHSRKKIMVFSSIGRMFLGLALFSLCFSGTIALWHIYSIAFIDSTIECFFGPAHGAVIPKIVDEKHLLAANSAVSMTTSVSQMVGMGAGGVIIGFIGIPAAFLIDAFTFLVAAISIAFIHLEEEISPSAGKSRLEDIKEGLSFVVKQRILLIIFLVAMILNFGAGALNVILPILSENLSLGAEGYGYMIASFSAGSLIGAIVLSAIGGSERTSAEKLVIIVPGVWTLCFLIAPLFHTLFPYILTFLIVGITIALGGAADSTILQKSTPDKLRGRVISVEKLIVLVMMPFSAAAAGPLIEFYGTGFTFYCVAGISFISFLLAFIGMRKNGERK